MNQYKVNQKKFITKCKQAITLLDKDLLEARQTGKYAHEGQLKGHRLIIHNALLVAESPIVEEVLVTEDFLVTLNYYLTEARAS